MRILVDGVVYQGKACVLYSLRAEDLFIFTESLACLAASLLASRTIYICSESQRRT
jgi:hypothetical protein